MVYKVALKIFEVLHFICGNLGDWCLGKALEYFATYFPFVNGWILPKISLFCECKIKLLHMVKCMYIIKWKCMIIGLIFSSIMYTFMDIGSFILLVNIWTYTTLKNWKKRFKYIIHAFIFSIYYNKTKKRLHRIIRAKLIHKMMDSHNDTSTILSPRLLSPFALVI